MMSIFSSMRVGTKLGLGYAVLLLMMLTMAIASMSGLFNVHMIVDDITGNAYPKVQLSNDLDSGVVDAGTTLRDLILKTDEPAMKQLRDRLQAIRDEQSVQMDALGKLLDSPEEQRLFKSLQNARASYAQAADRVVELASVNMNAQATEVLYGDLEPVQTQYTKLLNDMVEMQEASFAEDDQQEQVEYDRARVLSFALLGLALVIGVGLAVWITRSLIRQLGGEPQLAADISRRIAEGDLGVTIPLRHNDTGSVLAAMKSMVDKLSQIIGEVRGAADSLTSSSEELAATAEEMSGQAEQLQQLMRFFTLASHNVSAQPPAAGG